MQNQDVIFGLEGLEQIWLIEPRAGRAMMWKLHQLQRFDFDMSQLYPDMQAKVHDDIDERERLDQLLDSYVTYVGDRAIVAIRGTLMKRQTMSSLFFGEGGMTYLDISYVVTALANDAKVAEIILDIDSPGGTVSGVQECSDVLYQVAQQKPLKAYCQDLCCSAGYWLASQANEIFANETAVVGSIGVYTVLVDSMAADSDAGFKRYVVTSGGVKGLGADGSVTDELLGEIQREVDELQAVFSKAIARGRNMTLDQVKKLADGQVYIGESALRRGLIDRISSHRDLFRRGVKGKKSVMLPSDTDLPNPFSALGVSYCRRQERRVEKMEDIQIRLESSISLFDVEANHLEKINNLSPSPPVEVQQDHIHVRAMKLTGDKLNSQLGRFHTEDLSSLAEMTVGAPVLIGHNKGGAPIARFFDGKAQDGFTINAFYFPRGTVGNELANNIDMGIFSEASISFTCEKLACSECDNDIRMPKCSHMPGKDGVFYWYEQIGRVLEGSIVYRGAHPDTGMVRDFVQLSGDPQWYSVFKKGSGMVRSVLVGGQVFNRRVA